MKAVATLAAALGLGFVVTGTSRQSATEMAARGRSATETAACASIVKVKLPLGAGQHWPRTRERLPNLETSAALRPHLSALRPRVGRSGPHRTGPGGHAVERGRRWSACGTAPTRKRRSHEQTGIRRFSHLYSEDGLLGKMATSEGVLALDVATLLLRTACRWPTWAYRDLSQSILFHPLSGWPFIRTSHKRLLPEPSRIPRHQHALSAPRIPGSNYPSGPVRRVAEAPPKTLWVHPISFSTVPASRGRDSLLPHISSRASQVTTIVAASAIRWSFDHGGPNVTRGP